MLYIKSHVHHLQLKLSRPFKFTMHEVEMWCFLPIRPTMVRPKFDHTHRFCEVAMPYRIMFQRYSQFLFCMPMWLTPLLMEDPHGSTTFCGGWLYVPVISRNLFLVLCIKLRQIAGWHLLVFASQINDVWAVYSKLVPVTFHEILVGW